MIVEDSIEQIKKTKDLEKIIKTLNLKSDLERAKKRKTRAGRGKMRGRPHKNKKSILFVVSEDKGLVNAAKNLAGVEACLVNNLNSELLAPGTHAGRLTVWSESAIRKVGEIYG